MSPGVVPKRIGVAVGPRWTSRGGFLLLLLCAWIFMAAFAAAVLYVVTSMSLYDPTEPWEWAGLVAFWWPMLTIGAGWGMPLSALWWIIAAWGVALVLDRGRGWYYKMEPEEDHGSSSG